MAKVISVKIAGKSYSLRGDAGDDRVKALAAFVDDALKGVARRTRVADSQSLAILTALSVAETLFAERDAHKEMRRQIRDKARSLLKLLERKAGV